MAPPPSVKFNRFLGKIKNTFGQKMFLAPSIVFASKFLGINFDDYLDLLYPAWGGAIVISCVVSIILYQKIYKENDTENYITVSSSTIGVPGSETEESMSVLEYDLAELSKLVFQSGMHTMITTGLHTYMGVTFPLVLQSIMMPINLKDSSLVQVHMLRKEASGELGRPWPDATNPFSKFMQQRDQAEAMQMKLALKREKKALKKKAK